MAAVFLDLDEISRLYKMYATDLRRVREEELLLYRAKGYSVLEQRLKVNLPFTEGSWSWPIIRRGVRAIHPSSRYFYPAFDDIESEITYLLIRRNRPKTIVEISPAGGWSTTWILQGVRDNGSGWVHSFDLIDDSTFLIPSALTRSSWRFTRGDVRRTTQALPNGIDYLFLDSLHSGSFARWYIANLFPKMSPGGVITIDDVFPGKDPLTQLVRKSDTNSAFGEPEVVRDWLSSHGLRFFSACPEFAPENFARLSEIRKELDLGPPIHDHESRRNPAIFFTIGSE